MSDKRAYLVTGRDMADVILCGHTVPPDAVHINCMACQRKLIISAEGARRLEAAKADPDCAMTGAMCVICATRLAVIRGLSGIETSPTGEKLLEEHAGARKWMELLKQRVVPNE